MAFPWPPVVPDDKTLVYGHWDGRPAIYLRSADAVYTISRDADGVIATAHLVEHAAREAQRWIPDDRWTPEAAPAPHPRRLITIEDE